MLCLVFAFSEDLFARAGGGDSYSSSKSSSRSSSGSSYTPSRSTHSSSRIRSSSSSSSDSEGCSIVPILIFSIILVAIVLSRRAKNAGANLANMPFSKAALLKAFPCGTQEHMPKGAVGVAIEEYRKLDPNFSRPMFLDFAQLLYTRYHVTRGSQELPSLSFYIAEDIIEKASKASENVKKIDNLIIGSTRIVNLKPNSGDSLDRITVAFEGNYSETILNSITQKDGTVEKKKVTAGFEISEIWHFVRKTGTVSPDNKPIKSITCPSCGASADTDSKGSCKSCGNNVSDGSFYWVLSKIEVEGAGLIQPITISSGGMEEGIELKTVYQKNMEDYKQAFENKYSSFSWPDFNSYVKDVFMNIQDAWTNGKWEKARPFETDHLFGMHNFWIEKYKKENMRNVLENIKVNDIKVCRIETDKYYDSITLRIFAEMKDYTVSLTGGFSKPSGVATRKFSEYWTFVRRSGVNPKHLSVKECPNCGAELNINMSGVCEYCSSKISSGEFSWVLSMIEQDEVYIG